MPPPAAAATAVEECLEQEKKPLVRQLYVSTLESINSERAHHLLIGLTLEDADEEIRYSSLQSIARLRPPGHDQTYVRALSDTDNRKVNRAATALATLDSVSTISPLIDALVTRHPLVMRRPGSRDAVTATFSDSGFAYSTGGTTHRVEREFKNESVLEALIYLSGGANFGYDPDAWRRWHESQVAAETTRLRER